MTRQAALRLGLVLAVTAVCLGWVLAQLDLDQAVAALRSARGGLIVPMFLGYFVAHLLRTARLGLLLDAQVGFVGLLTVTTLGHLAINVAPLRLGELVRPYLLLERHRVPLGASVAALMVERALDATALLTLWGLVALVADLPRGGLVVAGVDLAVAGPRAVGAGVGGVLAGLVVAALAGRSAARLLERWGAGGVAGLTARLHEALVAQGRRPLRAAGAVACTAVIWGAVVASVGCLLGALPGLPASPEVALVTWTLTLTGMTLVPTPGFVGSFEVFCVAALALYGVGRAPAAAFALLLHLGQLGFILVLGGGFLAREGLSLGRLVRSSRQKARDRGRG